jgi:hypothetical protein
MSFLRHITAMLLAILIANPLCCCFAQADVAGEEAVHSCCSRPAPADEEAPVNAPCPGCQAKNPRLADGSTPLVISTAFFELPAIFAPRFDLPGLAQDLQGLNREPVTPAPPPPRLRLALQQRYLI